MQNPRATSAAGVADTRAHSLDGDNTHPIPDAGLTAQVATANAIGHDLRLKLGAEHLHALGARPLGEFLREIGTARGILPDIVWRLDTWRCLSPEMVRA